MVVKIPYTPPVFVLMFYSYDCHQHGDSNSKAFLNQAPSDMKISLANKAQNKI